MKTISICWSVSIWVTSNDAYGDYGTDLSSALVNLFLVCVYVSTEDSLVVLLWSGNNYTV